MRTTRTSELIEFAKQNFDNVRVIGVVNPSIIIEEKGKVFVVYMQGAEFAVAYKERDRETFKDKNQLIKIVKKLIKY